MINLLVDFYNNKLLFYGVIVVIVFIIISVILIKRINKEKKEDSQVDYQKIDGDKSLFDKAIVKSEDSARNNNKLDLESMIEKMQKDLDAKASEVVEKFENEQEEKSVISYKELIQHEKQETENINKTGDTILDEKINTNKKVDDFLDEVIGDFDGGEELSKPNDLDLKETYINALEIEEDNSVDNNEVSDELDEALVSKLNKKDEFVNAIKTGDLDDDTMHNSDIQTDKFDSDENIIKDNDFRDENSLNSKFKATEFISPIYGVQDIKIQYPTVQNMNDYKKHAYNYNKFELEQTLNMEPLSDEIRKNEDFLKALKEFRKNLE